MQCWAYYWALVLLLTVHSSSSASKPRRSVFSSSRLAQSGRGLERVQKDEQNGAERAFQAGGARDNGQAAKGLLGDFRSSQFPVSLGQDSSMNLGYSGSTSNFGSSGSYGLPSSYGPSGSYGSPSSYGPFVRNNIPQNQYNPPSNYGAPSTFGSQSPYGPSPVSFNPATAPGATIGFVSANPFISLGNLPSYPTSPYGSQAGSNPQNLLSPGNPFGSHGNIGPIGPIILYPPGNAAAAGPGTLPSLPDLISASRAFISPGIYYPTFQGNPFAPPPFFGPQPPDTNSMFNPNMVNPSMNPASMLNNGPQLLGYPGYSSYPRVPSIFGINQPPSGFPGIPSGQGPTWSGQFSMPPPSAAKKELH